MRRRTRILAVVLAALIISTLGALYAGVLDLGGVFLDRTGKATAPLRLSTSVPDLAGVQGTLTYDPIKVSSISLSMGPDQPGSFSLKSYSPTPGQVNFVVYSTADTLKQQFPILLCRIEADPAERLAAFQSVLIYEMTAFATPNGQAQYQVDNYVNVPLVAPQRTGAQKAWLDY